MPTFEINLSSAAVARLQAVVSRYNANTGESLTVKEWVLTKLREMAIGEELIAAIPELERQRDTAFAQAIEAKKKELLDGLEGE